MPVALHKRFNNNKKSICTYFTSSFNVFSFNLDRTCVFYFWVPTRGATSKNNNFDFALYRTLFTDSPVNITREACVPVPGAEHVKANSQFVLFTLIFISTFVLSVVCVAQV